MAVYLVGQIKINDSRLWQQYVAGVAESLAPYAARIIFRGQRISVLAGDNERDLAVVIEFSDRSALDSWFNSEQYQSLVSLRDRAADVVITTYDAY